MGLILSHKNIFLAKVVMLYGGGGVGMAPVQSADVRSRIQSQSS
jgi:hypothetical protein